MINITLTDNREAEPKSTSRTILGYPNNHAAVHTTVSMVLISGFTTDDVTTIDETTGAGRVGFNKDDKYDAMVLESTVPTTEQAIACIAGFLDVKVMSDDMYNEIVKVVDSYFSTSHEAIANDPDSFAVGPIVGNVLKDNPTAFCSPEWMALMCRDYLLVGLDHLSQYEELPWHLWTATIDHYQTRLQELGTRLAEHYRSKLGEVILAPEVIQGWIQLYNEAWDGFVADNEKQAVEASPTLH